MLNDNVKNRGKRRESNVVKIRSVSKGSRQFIITFPTRIFDKMGLAEGDFIEFIVTPRSDAVIITKKII